MSSREVLVHLGVSARTFLDAHTATATAMTSAHPMAAASMLIWTVAGAHEAGCDQAQC